MNKDLDVYYHCTETLLIGISENDQVNQNRENAIILNNGEKHILKDTIEKFGFDIKIPELHLYMIEYMAELILTSYGVFKKAKIYLYVPNTKSQIEKKLELISGYKALKSFQATVVFEQNLQLHLYETRPQKAQFY